MKTSLHRIITEDGIELVGLLYEPDTKTDKVLVHVHGMGGNFYENNFLDAIAKKLTDNNIAFFVFNNRGCEIFKDLTKTMGDKKTYVRIGNAYEKFEDCVFDIGAAISFVHDSGFRTIHLSGHSLGSPKVIYYLSQTHDTRVRSVLLLSPSDMLGLVRDEPGFKQDMQEAMDLVQAGKGMDLISKQVWDEYPISANTYLSLYADESKAAIFNFYDPNDKLTVLSTITHPIFTVMGRKDDCLVISIEDTMERITKASTKSEKVLTKILGDANHGYTGHEDELAGEIYKWIREV